MVRRAAAGTTGASGTTGEPDTGQAGTGTGTAEWGAGTAEPPSPPNAEQLVADAVAAAGDPATAALVARYWRFVADEELADHSPPGLLAVVRRHRELARQRLPGEVRLALTDRTDRRRTLIDVVVDDMPFLVDSVTGALTTAGIDIHLLAHPLVVVRRTPLGALTEVAGEVEPDDAIPGDTVESWIHLEIDPVREPQDRQRLETDLRRVLTDVREAVEDWPKMRASALRIADELADALADGSRPPVPDKDLTDAVALLRWLADDHFTFLGYREYELLDGPADPATGQPERLLVARPGSGLGILRNDQPRPRRISSMTGEAQAKVYEQRLLIITKANSRATVHRTSYLDYIGLKEFDADGRVVGERRFLGLFASSAYHDSVRNLPVVSRKVAEVLARSGLSPHSHSGKDLLGILESYPRDELFSISTDDLYRTATGVLRMAGRRQLRVFLRRDDYGRFTSCLVYLPRDRYTTANRLRMQEILLRRLRGVGVDHTTWVTESVLARVHFIVRTDPTRPAAPVTADRLAAELAEATRSWDGDFALALAHRIGDEQAKRLRHRYAGAFPESYKDRHTPAEAVHDLAKLELLEEPGQAAMHLFEWRGDTDRVRFKVYRYGEPTTLSEVLPVLHSLGVRVTDEYPYRITRADGTVHLYDFGLELPAGSRPASQVRGQVENAFSTAWRGEAEVDGFNALVLRAGLSWRQVVLLRAYAKYLRQLGMVFSPEYVQSTLARYPRVPALLVALFEVRFDPAAGPPEQRAERGDRLAAELERELTAVDSLDQDRIIRSYLALVRATVRTSYFQRGPDGRPKPAVAFKLEPRRVPDLPEPRPRYEIFVYSPRFEGVHLRFGTVARGGVRWSDRRDDFRTEILELAKAQSVKNAVIVPAGAKGGFVLKDAVPPEPVGAARPDRAETTPADTARTAAARYREFVAALLDVTDNLVDGAVVPPTAVVRHDGDDPYLVVAPDKGTARFSDLANEVATGRGYWLGDAFASGGSRGYDHKRMGITARGAWESVTRHFRQLGVDPEREPVTVVGIGDMSGDVFGNGMLRSRRLRLVAAFDHRHIFLDPDPDPAGSYAERERLFALKRSSWDDYDRSLISDGGGVYPRTAKAVPVSPALAAVLGLADPPPSLTPAELIRAILLAPVDLLWNGGIGTYVKASTESHADVRDKANDPIRVDGARLRARVVGEGGNLGFTQRGRVEYALAGGLINTDFIDNSGGVDCSDREVNIKILLAGAGSTGADRDRLLADMTDEVAEQVLHDNYQQAAALARARAQAGPLLPVHRRMLTDLARSGALDRRLWALAEDDELADRTSAGRGLTGPELAVLFSHVKNLLQDEITDSPLPDEPWTRQLLTGYFPEPLRHRFGGAMADHPLRREIVSTVLVNEAVNRCGTSFVYRAGEETGAPAADVLRAYRVVREVYGLDGIWSALAALDGRAPVAGQTAALLTVRRLVDRAVRWLLQNRRSPLDVTAEVGALRAGVTRLLPRLDTFLRGDEQVALRTRRRALTDRGVPAELAGAVARLSFGFGLVDVVEVARSAGVGPVGDRLDRVAAVYFTLSERFGVDAILSWIAELPRQDRWQTLARMALRYDLYAALAALTGQVLATTPGELDPVARVFAWERDNDGPVTRTRDAIREFDAAHAGGGTGLAALSVLLRQIRTMVRTADSPGTG